MKNWIVSAAILLTSCFVFAQDTQRKFCGATEINNKYFEQNPEARAAKDILNAHTKNFSEPKSQQPPVYIIPVVFHIIHEYGSENISDAQCEDAIRVMNEDYRKLNPDTDDIVTAFKPIAADCEIEFRLARLDPDGNCTNGIERIVSPTTNVGDETAKLNPWPRNRYLNIWVVKSIASGAAGYSQYPSSVAGSWGAAVDGIMVLSTYVGSIGTGNYSRSRTLTHEAGHWLNLAHCWGNSNSPGLSGNCSDDDDVTDTPNTIGWTSCNLSGASCGSALDNVQNYMEYSYCSRMFTAGQRSRMRAALTSSVASRNNLWTSANLSFTGLNNPPVTCTPIADFFSDAQTICSGSTITFSDQSFNGTPTTWNWTFSGGNPASSSSQNPSVVYNTPGVYPVTLTVSNSAGSDDITKTSFIRVESSSPDITGNVFAESFESLTLSGSAWTVINSGGPAWAISSSSGFTGTKSMRINNLGSSIDDVDEFITPSFDLTQFTSPKLFFRYAYAQLPNSTASSNTLRVMVSTDCGKTWSTRRTLTGSALATVPSQSASFIPTQGSTTQWKQDNISLSTFSTFNNVLVKFSFTAGGGNNIFIDDININAPTGIAEDDILERSVNVFPNPSNGLFEVQFDLERSSKVSLILRDVSGRIVSQTMPSNNLSGSVKILMDVSGVSSGLYLLSIDADGKQTTRKVFVR
jgi:PKD repeat protein